MKTNKNGYCEKKNEIKEGGKEKQLLVTHGKQK